jgi:hypothetical protein
VTAPDINPATGRPYRLRSMRKRLAAAARERTEVMLARQLEGADARRDVSRGRDVGERGVDRVPAHLRDLQPRIVRITPGVKFTDRDRSLRGKDRIRARKAARRGAGQ